MGKMTLINPVKSRAGDKNNGKTDDTVDGKNQVCAKKNGKAMFK
jgi:hypothetical protein